MNWLVTADTHLQKTYNMPVTNIQRSPSAYQHRGSPFLQKTLSPAHNVKTFTPEQPLSTSGGIVKVLNVRQKAVIPALQQIQRAEIAEAETKIITSV